MEVMMSENLKQVNTDAVRLQQGLGKDEELDEREHFKLQQQLRRNDKGGYELISVWDASGQPGAPSVTAQPIGSKQERKNDKMETPAIDLMTYMANVTALSEAENMKKMEERSFCPSSVDFFCGKCINFLRAFGLVPPSNVINPLIDVIAAPCLLAVYGCPRKENKEFEIPEAALRKKPISLISSEGVMADTFFEFNDEIATSPVLFMWPRILHVDVAKSRATPRSCGACDLCFYDPVSRLGFDKTEGISYNCDIKCGICCSCCAMLCHERVVPHYSEVTIFSSLKGPDGMQALIDSLDGRRWFLREKSDRLAKKDMTLIAGGDISKITIKGLKDVDQYTSDLQRMCAQYRGGQPLSIGLNKRFEVFDSKKVREREELALEIQRKKAEFVPMVC